MQERKGGTSLVTVRTPQLFGKVIKIQILGKRLSLLRKRNDDTERDDPIITRK